MTQSQSEFRDIEALLRFVEFIPLEDEILDFFRPVAAHIMQQLRARPCLPTHGMKLPQQSTLGVVQLDRQL